MDEGTLLDATGAARVLGIPARTMRHRALRAHQEGAKVLSYVGGRWVAPLSWWRALARRPDPNRQ